MSQTNVKLALPQPEEVARIEITQTSGLKAYQPEELLGLLSKFVPSENTYSGKQPFQRGTFILKNGRKINWLANSADSILLTNDEQEQLYVLPKRLLHFLRFGTKKAMKISLM